MANNSGTRAPIIWASWTTLWLFISSILSNMFDIFTNLFPMLIAFFRKTSAIAVATLVVEVVGGWHGEINLGGGFSRLVDLSFSICVLHFGIGQSILTICTGKGAQGTWCVMHGTWCTTVAVTLCKSEKSGNCMVKVLYLTLPHTLLWTPCGLLLVLVNSWCTPDVLPLHSTCCSQHGVHMEYT